MQPRDGGTESSADDRVASLFKGLDFSRVDDRAGSLAGLIQEIWRLFLLAMMVALLVEAGLCLPRRTQPAKGHAAGVRGSIQETHQNHDFAVNVK